MAKKQSKEDSKPNLGRHEHGCKVCNHESRAQIEADFLSWKSPQKICEEYGLQDRTTVYRHAWALGLMERRRRSVRTALELIIEKAGDVEVTAGAVVQAVATYARINSNGLLIERKETVNMNELFEKMSREELLAYAEKGALPAWYTSVIGATGDDSEDFVIQ